MDKVRRSPCVSLRSARKNTNNNNRRILRSRYHLSQTMAYLLSLNIDPVTMNPYQCLSSDFHLSFLPSTSPSLFTFLPSSDILNHSKQFWCAHVNSTFMSSFIHPHTHTFNTNVWFFSDEVKMSGRIHEGKICVPPSTESEKKFSS